MASGSFRPYSRASGRVQPKQKLLGTTKVAFHCNSTSQELGSSRLSGDFQPATQTEEAGSNASSSLFISQFGALLKISSTNSATRWLILFRSILGRNQESKSTTCLKRNWREYYPRSFSLPTM